LTAIFSGAVGFAQQGEQREKNPSGFRMPAGVEQPGQLGGAVTRLNNPTNASPTSALTPKWSRKSVRRRPDLDRGTWFLHPNVQNDPQ
jgi:hypothetical protein